MKDWIKFSEIPLNPINMDRQRWEAGLAFEKHCWTFVQKNTLNERPLFHYQSLNDSVLNYANRELLFSDYKYGQYDSEEDKISEAFFLNDPINFSFIMPLVKEVEMYQDKSANDLFNYWRTILPDTFAFACHPTFLKNIINLFGESFTNLTKEDFLLLKNKKLIIQKINSVAFVQIMPILFSVMRKANFYIFPVSENASMITKEKNVSTLEKLVGYSSYTNFKKFSDLVNDFGWLATTHRNIENIRPICLYSANNNLLSSFQQKNNLDIKWTKTDNLFSMLDHTRSITQTQGRGITLFNKYTVEQLQNKKSIKLSNTNIAHVKDLKDFSTIGNLEINQNYIWDFERSLSALSHLKELSISNMTIPSFKFLSNLNELIKLELRNVYPFVKYLDISEVSNLKSLTLENGSIKEINCTKNTETLEYLALTNLELVDISFVEHCPCLTKVKLEETKITDLSPLHYLSMMKSLSINSSIIKDWSIFNQLDSLKELSLASNELDDLSVVFPLTHLEILDVSSNSIKDVRNLGYFPELKELSLSNNLIESLKGLPELEKLESFDIGGHKIEDFKLLKNVQFEKLKKLKIAFSNFNELQCISHFNQMEVLDISGTLVMDLKYLEQFSLLKELNLAHCVFEMNELEKINLPNLKILYLNGLKLQDFKF